jgi:hypothetical protein
MFEKTLTGATGCEVVDDRSESQKETHDRAVVAWDSFMSGWGGAQGGHSHVAWACSPKADFEKLYKWVKNRTDMEQVREIYLGDYKPNARTAHFHIYVCTENHPSQC